jgi:hypothetical protein
MRRRIAMPGGDAVPSPVPFCIGVAESQPCRQRLRHPHDTIAA